MKNNELFFAGHLEEVDDLKRFKRDAPIEITPENLIILDRIVDAIESKIKSEGSRALILIASSKQRSTQTAELVAEKLKAKLGSSFKVRFSVDTDLDPPDQGDFVLPENYNPGDYFDGLKIASKVFLDESLGEHHNLNYRFGDPVLLEDGNYKYPELAKYFTQFGETYGQSLSRILNSVIRASKKYDKFQKSVEVSIIAHGFSFYILRGLSLLAKKVRDERLEINPGELATKLLEIYEQDPISLRTTPFSNIDFSDLDNQGFIEILKNELVFLDKK